MTRSETIVQAVEKLKQAQAIVDAYLIEPHGNLTPRNMRIEIMRRLRAADHLANALHSVERLNHEFIRAEADGTCVGVS